MSPARPRSLLALLLAASLGLAACGGDEEGAAQTVTQVVTQTVTGQATSPDGAPTSTATTPPPPAQTPTDELIAELGRAGLEAEPYEVEGTLPPRAAAAVDIGGGSQVIVMRFASAARAAATARRYQADEDRSPDRIEVAIAGPTLYVALAPDSAQVSEVELQRVMMALGDG